MHIIRPAWLKHAAGSSREVGVLSCHVSPDGQRLATGGLDGQVKLWSTEAILNSMKGLPEGAPKQLCSMSTHSGSVSCVRFSGTNQFLASGSDDRVVLIYERDTSGSSRPVFGSGESSEAWITVRRLTGHENDVQDLGWSVDSSILVSVGLDSKIIVWSGYTFEKLKVIDAHGSCIKGITFDPANKYFATASDDRSIKIFRYTPPSTTATIHDQISNFVLEHTITKPFESSPLTAFFRRCSWSPDGSHIAAAAATNGPVSSVAIISRGQWDSDINLIGHENPVEVCAFSPRMFSKEKVNPLMNGKGAAPNFVTVIACAGQDKALSVWNTSHPRPLLITQLLAEKALTDLAWAPDGRTLFITSLDGSITTLVFEDGDLGYVASVEENDRVLAKYGANRKGTTLPEGVDMVRLEEKAKQGEVKEAEGKMGELMGSGAGTPAQSMVVPAPLPVQPVAPTPDKEPKVLKQKITITKEGKKRVAPLLVSSSSNQRSNLPNVQLLQQSSGTNSGPSGVTLELSQPYDKLPKGGLATLIMGNKRPHVEAEPADGPDATAKKTKKAAVTVINGDSERTDNLTEPPEFIRPAVVNPALVSSQIRTAVPKLRSIVTHIRVGAPADSANDVDSEATLEAKNSAATPREPTRITVTQEGKILWTEFLPRAVLLATGNYHFWALACEDGTIHTYSPNGRRLANPFVIEAQPVFLECKDWWLMSMSANGMVHVWNIQSLSSPHPPVSVGPVLATAATFFNPERPTKGESILEAGVSRNGTVVIGLTNGEGYAYSKDLFTWQKLSEPWWILGSEFSSSNRLEQGRAGRSDGLISHLERLTATQAILHNRGQFLSQMINNMDRKGTSTGFRTQISVGHLESRLAAAMVVGTKDEFKSYLMMYARLLGNENLVAKAEELCRELMGSMEEDEEDTPGAGGGRWGQGDEILGMSKKELLKSVILVMGKFRELQRIIVPYATILGINDEGDGREANGDGDEVMVT